MSLASSSRDICFDVSRMEGYRNFCNKLYNASSFVIMNIMDYRGNEQHYELVYDELSIIDRWIHHELNETIKIAHKYISKYRFDLVSQVLYKFVWHQYCDWYLEFFKIQLKLTTEKRFRSSTQLTLLLMMENILKLLHPVVPFITEKIFQKLKTFIGSDNPSIMISSYPKTQNKWINVNARNEVNWLQQIIITIRTIRTEVNIKPWILIPLYVANATKNDEERLKYFGAIIRHMAGIKKIKITNSPPQPSLIKLVDKLLLHIHLSGFTEPKAERDRLHKEQKKIAAIITRSYTKLNNQKFIDNAPENVIKKEKKKLVEAQLMQEKIKQQFENIS